MASELTFDHVQQTHMGGTRRLAESFLGQLSRSQLFMDVDIIAKLSITDG